MHFAVAEAMIFKVPAPTLVSGVLTLLLTTQRGRADFGREGYTRSILKTHTVWGWFRAYFHISIRAIIADKIGKILFHQAKRKEPCDQRNKSLESKRTSGLHATIEQRNRMFIFVSSKFDSCSMTLYIKALC